MLQLCSKIQTFKGKMHLCLYRKIIFHVNSVASYIHVKLGNQASLMLLCNPVGCSLADLLFIATICQKISLLSQHYPQCFLMPIMPKIMLA